MAVAGRAWLGFGRLRRRFDGGRSIPLGGRRRGLRIRRRLEQPRVRDLGLGFGGRLPLCRERLRLLQVARFELVRRRGEQFARPRIAELLRAGEPGVCLHEIALHALRVVVEDAEIRHCAA